jgi:hypothetical protein
MEGLYEISRHLHDYLSTHGYKLPHLPDGVSKRDCKGDGVIKPIIQYCNQRNLSLEEVVEPCTARAVSCRDGAIAYMAHTLKKNDDFISYFWGLPIEYVRGVLKPETIKYYKPKVMY